MITQHPAWSGIAIEDEIPQIIFRLGQLFGADRQVVKSVAPSYPKCGEITRDENQYGWMQTSGRVLSNESSVSQTLLIAFEPFK